jgi:hypothetical protein
MNRPVMVGLTGLMGLAGMAGLAVIFAAGGSFASDAPAQAPPSPPPPSLEKLAWMAGDWEMHDGTSCTEEYWTLPSSDKLIGMSRTVDKGKTRSFEFMRLEARADGIYYVAQPGGRPPVDFRLSSEPGPELVFVNPGHADHLKRIVYRRDGDAGLAARIEGENGGKPFAVDFAYRRAPSSAASRCGAVK